MKQFDQTVLDVVGNTPIIKLSSRTTNVDSEIYAKLEFLNPGGSIKDRIGTYMLEQAIERGDLRPGGTIIEGTSGNTGVGLAMFAALHGYKTIFVLADKQSPEKIQNLRAFGAKVIVCPTNVEPGDPRSYYSVAKRLAETTPNSFYVNQYDNLDNRATHFKTTGPEIYRQTQGEFDVFMAGVGTGGTISGIGAYLKSKMPHVQIVGIDIQGSILAHFKQTGEIGEAHPYILEGIGEDILPQNVDWDVIDDFVMVEDKESFIMTRKLLTQEAIYAGGSSGAAVVGAIKYARTLAEPKRILIILPDSGNRYASKIYNDDWMRENGFVDSSFNVIIKEVLETLRKGKKQCIYTCPETSTIGDAIQVMQEHDVSQFPVLAGDKVVGVVSESDLLRPVYEGKLALSDNISVAYKDTFQIIDANDMLENVAEALLQRQTVIISEQNRIVDILTDIDVLNFISSKGRY
ncbi:MAG TPA: pyridoxal-phosphate dependent enzyme [Candidatus Entotheonella sp.]